MSGRSAASRKRIENMRATIMPRLEEGLVQLLEVTEDAMQAARDEELAGAIRVAERCAKEKKPFAAFVQAMREELRARLR